MQLIQTLIDRFYGVPIPRETYMRVHSNMYRIFQVGRDRIWYALDQEGSPVNILKLGDERSLTIVKVLADHPRKIGQKPKYIFNCVFKN